MIGFDARTPSDLAVDHTIDVDAPTGTARLRVPVPTTPGRESFGPTLVLAYGSGSRNSPFGVGWMLSGVGSIGLDTRDGIPEPGTEPRYAVAGGIALVPMLRDDGGAWAAQSRAAHGFVIDRYRRKVERAFERYERWTDVDGRVHWRVLGRDGTVSVFGLAADDSSRVADPSDPSARVHGWLLESQYDRKGNAVEYVYKAEDDSGVDLTAGHEAARRRGAVGHAQRYLKRVRYGNTRPMSADAPTDPANRWSFELVLDYGEHVASTPAEDQPWPARTDSFSVHRPGFDLRTHRLCRRIMQFHSFPALNGGAPTRVRTVELTHREDPSGSVLERIQIHGSRTDGGVTTERSAPPLRLSYSQPSVASSFDTAEAADNLPSGLDGAAYQWMDVRNEGLPGVLSRRQGAWYFKDNLGGGRFGPMRVIDEVPVAVSAAFHLNDFDGDGNLDLVGFEGREAGAFRHDRETDRWEGFEALSQLPRVDFANADVQWLDLNADGHLDLVVTRQDTIVWYPSEGTEGFGAPIELARPDVDTGGPPTLRADAALHTRFADMTGDGLPDIVRIDNGRVEYWPNLGRGRFGPGVVMHDAPQLDSTEQLDHGRVRLADLDGSGTADLLYIDRGELRYWINQSGNGFGAEHRRVGLPYIDNLASAQVFDFLGDGSRCLVWSSANPSMEGQALQFLRLTEGLPPRLLVGTDNGVGRRVSLTYRSSARDYLRDRADGREWHTRLPTHTMVVDTFTGHDRIGGTWLSTSYEYHDGFYDDEERRFVGFGHVDTVESGGVGSVGGLPPEDLTQPSLIRTWYHTGAPSGWGRRRADFYSLDPVASPLPDPGLDTGGLTTAEQVDAFRSLAGTTWRVETFGLRPDGDRETHPFRTVEFAYRIRRLQPETDDHDAAYSFDQTQSLAHEYEQDPADPRIEHNLLLARDEVGNVTSRASVAYPRRGTGPQVLPAQRELHLDVSTTSHLNIDSHERYELGIEVEARAMAVHGASAAALVFDHDELDGIVQTALSNEVAFHEPTPPGLCARTVGWSRNRFWNTARDDVAAIGEVGATTLLHHSEEALLPEAAVAGHFEGLVDAATLAGDGGYVATDGMWWAPTETMHYRGPDEFFRLLRQETPGGGGVTVTFDDALMLVTGSEDVVGSRVTSEPDYHVMTSARIVDANGNVAQVRYDPLGVAVARSVRGTQVGEDGAVHPVGDDDLGGWVEPASVASALADPVAALGGASHATVYDLEAFEAGGGPPRVLLLEREEHLHDGNGGGTSAPRVRVGLAYLDGFGRSIQNKVLAGPGPAIARVGGTVEVGADGRPVETGATQRWLTSGHVVFNNRGWVVRVHEPFFSPAADFEDDDILRALGQATRTRYDAVGRVVREDAPDGTFASVEFSSWSTRRSDPNDNVIGSTWEADVLGLPATDPRRAALDKARAHANTPTVTDVDGRGRPIRMREIGEGGVDRITTSTFGADRRVASITDPRGVTAQTYRHDMLGRVVADTSADGGRRLALLDAAGRALWSWDARGVRYRNSYDSAGRLIRTRVDGTSHWDGTVLDHVVFEQVWGDAPAATDAADRNARGRVVLQRDTAGTATTERFHLDGQPIEGARRLRADHVGVPDWSNAAGVALGAAQHVTRSRVDALGRVVRQEAPDGTTREFSRSHLGYVDEVRVTTADGGLTRQVVASDITTNARGQRTSTKLGNGVVTDMAYDDRTFRLVRLHAHGVKDFLDVAYTYDPAGNITRWVDAVQQPGAVAPLLQGLTVSAEQEFTYDAHYQLTAASGRVHQALLQHDYRAGRRGQNPIKGTRHLSFNNGGAVERYTRTYRYDLSGNIERVRHNGATVSWTTDMWVSPTSNRQLPALDPNGVPVANPEAAFDEAGHVTRLPHLAGMDVDHSGRLSRVVIIDRSAQDRADDAEYYVYDGTGLRVRRVTERVLAHDRVERVDTVYLPGCEIRTVSVDGNPQLIRRTSHLTDGTSRVATLHQWDMDQSGAETDDVARKNLHYVVGNHLGSVSLELAHDQRVISYEEYFPFGGTAFVAGDNATEVKLKDYRYSGKCRDDATGLYCYEYRYYAPFIGNWISPDPLGPVDGLNLYQFVRNNPIRFIDPDGLQTSGYVVFSLPEGLTPEQLQDKSNTAAAERFHAHVEGRPWIDGDRLVNVRGHVEWRSEVGAYVFIYTSVTEVVPPEPEPTEITFEPETITVDPPDASGGEDSASEEPPATDPGASADADADADDGTGGQNGSGHDASATGGDASTGGASAGTNEPGGGGTGDRGSGPGGGQQGSGPGAGGVQPGGQGSGDAGDGPGAGRSRTRTDGQGDGDGTAPTSSDASGTGTGTGDGTSASPNGSRPPGSGQGGTGTSSSAPPNAPAPPPGLPTSAEGVPFDPANPPPEEVPEEGTPVTDPAQVQRGTPGADPRSQGGTDDGSANRPGGTEGGGPGGTPEGQPQGQPGEQSGNSGEPREGGRPDGGNGLKGGGGDWELPSWLSWVDDGIDYLQIGLDIVGLIPGLGEIADGLNGLISLARGDYTGAMLSFGAMIPFAGWGAAAAKWGRRGARAAGLGADAARTTARYSDEVAGAATTVSKHADEALDAAPQQSFADLFSPDELAELSNHPAVIDRLSRAREFDIGGYRSLTGRGPYGRPGDNLDSDEALQNLFVRERRGVSRSDAILRDNPATALSPSKHRRIRNLKSADIVGMSAEEVLRHHLDEMAAFTPHHVLITLERESLAYIGRLGL